MLSFFRFEFASEHIPSNALTKAEEAFHERVKLLEYGLVHLDKRFIEDNAAVPCYEKNLCPIDTEGVQESFQLSLLILNRFRSLNRLPMVLTSVEFQQLA